jgi:6-phosphogluconolactonase (cycloisomerase 2 family)
VNNVATPNIPSSVTVDTKGTHAYVTSLGNETISGYAINQSSGALTSVSTFPVNAGTGMFSIVINPTGKFAYTVDEGFGSVSGYRVSKGSLTPLPGSPWRSAFSGAGSMQAIVDPSGHFVYVVNTDAATSENDVSAFKIDQTTGTLTPVSGSPFQAGEWPRSIAIARPH